MQLKLKAKRVANGLKQSDVAKKIGIAPATYTRKENGVAYFSFQEILKLLKLFDCKFEELFEEEI